MFLTWFIAGVVLGFILGTFLENIIDLAKELLEDLPKIVKKVGVYLQRIPGAIKAFFRYIKNGRMVEKETPDGERELTDEELKEMLVNGEITQREYNALVRGQKTHHLDVKREV